MNNGPGIILVALTVVWGALLFQKRRGPRIVFGMALIVVQIGFMASYLGMASEYFQLHESQNLFLKKAKRSLENGSPDQVLKAINLALANREKTSSSERMYAAFIEMDRNSNSGP